MHFARPRIGNLIHLKTWLMAVEKRPRDDGERHPSNFPALLIIFSQGCGRLFSTNDQWFRQDREACRQRAAMPKSRV
jgi:hypothetical protein